jgi:ATP-binding cassette subfamily B (MDR/TAP) protein 1
MYADIKLCLGNAHITCSIAEATAAAGRIISVRSSGPQKEQARMPSGRNPAKVEFKNVYFTYKDRDIPVLQGINLKVGRLKASKT